MFDFCIFLQDLAFAMGDDLIGVIANQFISMPIWVMVHDAAVTYIPAVFCGPVCPFTAVLYVCVDGTNRPRGCRGLPEAPLWAPPGPSRLAASLSTALAY